MKKYEIYLCLYSKVNDPRSIEMIYLIAHPEAALKILYVQFRGHGILFWTAQQAIPICRRSNWGLLPTLFSRNMSSYTHSPSVEGNTDSKILTA